MKRAIGDMEKHGRKRAIDEYKYRLAYRQEVFRLHLELGVAWTACGELARGAPDDDDGKSVVAGCATLRMNRDISQSQYETAIEKINAIKLEIRLLENEINQGMGYGSRR